MDHYEHRHARFSSIDPAEHAAKSGGTEQVAAGMPARQTYDFYWSRRALCLSGWVLALFTLAMLPVVFAEGLGVRVLGLLGLAAILRLSLGVASRATFTGPVLSIDMLGITVRRLGARRVHWQEIATFVKADLAHARTIEFFLKWPERQREGRRAGLRFGAWLQQHMGLPAATISLLLIDARAEEVARAITEFRPGLLPVGMRRTEG